MQLVAELIAIRGCGRRRIGLVQAIAIADLVLVLVCFRVRVRSRVCS
ncbi:MAG: hypothetical protein MZW92_46510 [Comamonadaceae bacterium]|nr:hypothetical protein [Comamonadaceae bacterium]